MVANVFENGMGRVIVELLCCCDLTLLMYEKDGKIVCSHPSGRKASSAIRETQ